MTPKDQLSDWDLMDNGELKEYEEWLDYIDVPIEEDMALNSKLNGDHLEDDLDEIIEDIDKGYTLSN